MESPEGGKPRKRTSAKADAKPKGPKVNVNLSLSVDAARRLAVHAVGVGKDRGEVVDELIEAHLRRFVLQDRGGAPVVNTEGPADPEVEGLPSTETLTPPDDASGALEPGKGRGRGGRGRPAA